MTAIDNTPVNMNYLSPLRFQFTLKRAPHINWFIQSINLPGVSVPPAEASTPFTNIPWFGLKPSFEQLHMTFKVDEDLQNYIELYTWMMSGSDPDNGDDYGALAANPDWSANGIHSDMSLLVLDQQSNPLYRIEYVTALPISLSELIFDTKDTDVMYINCTAVFAYRRFFIRPIPGSVSGTQTDIPQL